jgi:hypothetical protein
MGRAITKLWLVKAAMISTLLDREINHQEIPTLTWTYKPEICIKIPPTREPSHLKGKCLLNSKATTITRMWAIAWVAQSTNNNLTLHITKDNNMTWTCLDRGSITQQTIRSKEATKWTLVMDSKLLIPTLSINFRDNDAGPYWLWLLWLLYKI